MPELPEVETIKNDLIKEILGYKITYFVVNTPKMISPSSNEIIKKIKNLQIKGIQRRGKLIIMSFKEKEIFLLFHLKMTGRLLIQDPKDEKEQWVRIVIGLAKNNPRKNKEIRFSDIRKFGFVKLINKKELHSLLEKLGTDALELDFEEFKSILKKSYQQIKIVLMDQSLIAGIGNIYSNEALFEAGINPREKANKLNISQDKDLLKSLKMVLKKGILYRGASDNTYLDAYGKKGFFQNHFKVYKKKDKPCVRCGFSIKRIILGQRSTFFCPNCQNSK